MTLNEELGAFLNTYEKMLETQSSGKTLSVYHESKSSTDHFVNFDFMLLRLGIGFWRFGVLDFGSIIYCETWDLIISEVMGFKI